MSNIVFTNIPRISQVECEEYFPLRVVFDPSIGDTQFVSFYGGENNMLEFSVNSNTNLIKKLQVVTCKDYEVLEDNLSIPSVAQYGSVCLMYPQHNNCDIFSLSVYKNGIHIALSSKVASGYYAMGQILFGMGNDGSLVSLIVTNLTADEISHTIFELQSE